MSTSGLLGAGSVDSRSDSKPADDSNASQLASPTSLAEDGPSSVISPSRLLLPPRSYYLLTTADYHHTITSINQRMSIVGSQSTHPHPIFSLPPAIIEFILLPFLTINETIQITRGFGSPKKKKKEIDPLTGKPSRIHFNQQRSNFSCLLTSPHVLQSRGWLRLKFLFRRTAKFEFDLYQQYWKNYSECHPPSLLTNDVFDLDQFQAAIVEANQLIQAKSTKELFQTRQGNDQPLALNFIHFLEQCIHYRDLGHEPNRFGRGPNTPEEAAKYHLIRPGSLSQLHVGGLIFPTEILSELQSHAHLDDQTTKVNSVSTVPPEAPVPNPLQLGILKPGWCLVELSLAATRLLTLTCAMRSKGTIFNYCTSTSLSHDRAASYQLHPFLLRWPTNRFELFQVMRKYLVTPSNQAADMNELEVEFATSEFSPPSCGGQINPDIHMTDEELKDATQGICTNTEYVPPDYTQYRMSGTFNSETAWTCTHQSIGPHLSTMFIPKPEEGTNSSSSSHTAECAAEIPIRPVDHLTNVRGCLWSHCTKSSELVVELILRMMGVSTKYSIYQTQFYRPGIRTDWSSLFRCSPPGPTFLGHSNGAGTNLHPPTPELSNLLGQTLPSSLCIVTSNEVDGYPLPWVDTSVAFIVAPLSKGWIGGFIAGANRASH